jgi:oligopeptide/dipeptide ABC transporter ATP-binding protein
MLQNLPAGEGATPPSAPGTLLAIRDLVVGYDRYEKETVNALNGIELEVREGDILGLVGESGAGKSLLARTIMNSIPGGGRVSAGRIDFLGERIDAMTEEQRTRLLGNALSMVVSNPRGELNPVLTVGEQIGNMLRYHKGLSPAAALDEALSLLKAVQIPAPERRLSAYPHELSGGMAQRVVIAIALACTPRLVISDDATSALDVTVQMQVLDLMTDMVRQKGASAILITRDIAITAHFCNQVAILYAGEVVELADTALFFDRPTHPYSIMLFAAFSHDQALRRHWTRPADPAVATGGCAFAPRCPRRQHRCVTERPALRSLGPGRKVRCHFPVEA